MKKIILLFVLAFFLLSARAQKKQNVYYFKNDGKEVSVKDSADYIRIIQEPDSGETNFVFHEFYVNGKRKTIAKVSAFEPRLVFEGTVLKLNALGKRINITNYENGSPTGMSYQYFDNGKLHKQIEYLAKEQVKSGNIIINSPMEFGVQYPASASISTNSSFKLIYQGDSLGVAQVTDGNGYAKEVIRLAKDEEIVEGPYKDGFKHGVWKESQILSGQQSVETYEMGKLVSGETTKDGIKYAYNNFGVPPQFKGGIQKFYQYMSNAMRYPADALKERASGTVIVEFVVEKDGSLSEIQVKKPGNSSLDYEAKRVVKSSPKWLPGTLKGVPTRVKFTIPVKFSLPQ